MDRLTAMRVFTTVVDLGSQSAAADHLDLSRPVVSRYLAELEEWVGARLMHRTTRKLSLTAAGFETLPRCRQLLELADDLQATVSVPGDAPRGLLRISVSTSFGQAQLASAVTDYVRLNPQVSIDLQMLDRTVNLVDERIDLAIRTSNDLDPNLIARKLTVCRSVLCASPAYLREHPAPQQVEELSRHNCLTHSYYGKSLWHFTRGGEDVAVPVQGNISANEASTLLSATLAGAGVSLLPTYQAGIHVQQGTLVRLLPQAEPRVLNIYAVYASRKHMPATLRSMLDFLAARFTEEPAWDI
ncbi:LysR family transcriptional regulator [Pseudomonas versuta]|uniref:LysR family transcriptional regulator n=1 Tax=Pseudomonas versuta TaxID=1788301 RepID=A0A0M5LVA0_9PSED|nr:LysR family transcriptional regulator [Pseudomonas versuta]ALE87150.1 LysR family transcriptional regulator [Pseudomonas versuta]OKA24465.1 LysR family transcriptional regulator [Pseudomonas versuta]OKA28311.1 LysR family transcriptional regulator [Pseudomonas versuta]